MVFERLRRIIRLPHQKVAAFCRGRSTQADEQFVADCGLPPEPEAARIALAVRRAVAAVGSVDSAFIRVDDDYPGTLDVLPLWDSMSWYEFLVALEEQLGTPIDDPSALRVADPERVSVGELVIAVYQYLTTKQA
jgi:acyl carrier protein